MPRNLRVYAAKAALKVIGSLTGRATNKRAEILFMWSQVRIRFTSLESVDLRDGIPSA